MFLIIGAKILKFQRKNYSAKYVFFISFFLIINLQVNENTNHHQRNFTNGVFKIGVGFIFLQEFFEDVKEEFDRSNSIFVCPVRDFISVAYLYINFFLPLGIRYNHSICLNI